MWKLKKYKPVLVSYDFVNDTLAKESPYNMIFDEKEGWLSFRCPNRTCGLPIKVGFPKCPFCKINLRWKYPFAIIKLESETKKTNRRESNYATF